MTSVGADQAVTSDRLLLVEGQDEKNLSAAMLAHWDIRGVQVVAVGGKDGFAPGLEALMLTAEAGGRPPSAIGVMRDADDSPDSALQSVTSALRVAGLATPDSHGAFAPGPPSVGVFILPDGESQGAIEDLCWASVEDTSAARCSADYLECLRGAAALRSKMPPRPWYMPIWRHRKSRMREPAKERLKAIGRSTIRHSLPSRNSPATWHLASVRGTPGNGIPNRLIDETSPYLLQHAHNPVDWYPWGEEALQRAKAEDKPILLSVGYSACHWCHVMERESFEDARIAELMNAQFVCIEVDREERPDVDSIDMGAVQAMSGVDVSGMTAEGVRT